MEQSFVAPRRPILFYHRFPATLLKPGLTGKPMAKGKHRFFAKWRHTALSVGFLTIILAASAHAQGSEYIYWIEVGGGGKIRRANLDGTNPVDRVTGVGNGYAIALDLTNNHIYWTEQAVPGYIRRANLDGTNSAVLITGVASPRGIALDLTNNHMYWVEAGSSKIRRANLDGTNPVDHITGVSGGIGIALQIASSSSSSGSSQVIRYVPFKSQYVVLALFSLLGCWYVLRPH